MKTLQIENDYIGFLEDSMGRREFYSLKDALNALMQIIMDYEHLLKEYPKANWGIGYRGDDDKWVQVYKISTRMIRKLQKINLV